MQGDRLDIYCPAWTVGVQTDAEMLTRAISLVSKGRLACRTLKVPMAAYESPGADTSPPAALGPIEGTSAIFIERLIDRDWMEGYQQRFLLPHPEWFNQATRTLTTSLSPTILHKTRYSRDMLADRFPDAGHFDLGWSSPDPGVTVSDYNVFSHFRGKAKTRNTQKLLDLWGRRPDLPALRVHAWGPDLGLWSPGWMSRGNLHLRLGALSDRDAYFRELAQGGVHLCLSETEAFGHYINEARAMSALVVTVDGPPMNELIDNQCGRLTPYVREASVDLGKAFTVTAEAIEAAVDAVVAMPVAQRRELGRQARERYLNEDARFLSRLADLLDTL